MSQLFETIKCKDGNLPDLRWHNARMEHALGEVFGISGKIDLERHIIVPENCRTGLFRCRVTYAEQIVKIEFIPHKYRKIESLKLVVDNGIDYRFKFADRGALHKLFEKRGDCDDILIIKNGCVTDSFTANPVFFDGKKWWAPDTYLLKGTQRERLLYERKVNSCRISPGDFSKYKKVGLINALQDLEDMPVIRIENVKFVLNSQKK